MEYQLSQAVSHINGLRYEEEERHCNQCGCWIRPGEAVTLKGKDTWYVCSGYCEQDFKKEMNEEVFEVVK